LGSDTGQPPVTCTGGGHQLVAWLFAVHIRLSRSNALAMVRMSLRMIATIATFADFPPRAGPDISPPNRRCREWPPGPAYKSPA
jgi:hypothetical protein